ncbi:MAG: CoA pyrophosphatase, partial [Pseudomonadales bacterium]|nr:CoA pyrophosphatase [Pseudomonadales bacterium]
MISTQTITEQLAQHQPALSNTGDCHAAVALILDSAASTDDPEIVFIERARVLGDPWSGHIAFPGGRWEPDDKLPLDTAVRETEEEIGVDLSAARLLGRLDDLTGRRSHHLVVS